MQIIKHLPWGNYLQLIKIIHFGCMLASLVIKFESYVNYPGFSLVHQMLLVAGSRNKLSHNIPNCIVWNDLLVGGGREGKGIRTQRKKDLRLHLFSSVQSDSSVEQRELSREPICNGGLSLPSPVCSMAICLPY